ncbi:MAG: WD40 repeat domain-containing protein [Magnetococcales bacterium]|nr:WD40 repeat domain-containing protein [Magnetococcales bacterium]
MSNQTQHYDLDEYIVSALFSRDGHRVALALGDGTVALIDCQDLDAEIKRVRAHKSSCLSLAQDGSSDFLTGGDDGCIKRIKADGTVEMVAELGRSWIERVISHPESGVIACGAGRDVVIMNSAGEEIARHTHESTVADLTFSPAVPVLASAHYNAVTLIPLEPGSMENARLEWSGSHTLITWSPDSKTIVTAMQESALHVLNLDQEFHFGMQGYPSKVTSMGWINAPDLHLVTSGATGVVAWPWTGPEGPQQGEPKVFHDTEEVLVMQVACSPIDDRIAAGFEDGVVVMISAEQGFSNIIHASDDMEITALAWSDDGTGLIIGDENGTACVMLDL